MSRGSYVSCWIDNRLHKVDVKGEKHEDLAFCPFLPRTLKNDNKVKLSTKPEGLIGKRKQRGGII